MADQILPTLVSPMLMPSLSHSPCIRGAPDSGFSPLVCGSVLVGAWERPAAPVDLPGPERTKALTVPR